MFFTCLHYHLGRGGGYGSTQYGKGPLGQGFGSGGEYRRGRGRGGGPRGGGGGRGGGSGLDGYNSRSQAPGGGYHHGPSSHARYEGRYENRGDSRGGHPTPAQVWLQIKLIGCLKFKRRPHQHKHVYSHRRRIRFRFSFRAMEVQIRLEMLKDLVVMHTIPMSEEDKAVQVDRPRCQRQFPPRPRLNSR